ncbi:AAA family ATPase [Cellulomonas composti]|uniref:Pilus biosynthesis protein CpaE n=1 Tax=Cellulomonas composti TaxID=266130 RepID=A0A511JAW2_9CELL|nr:hypothetical protein [Cellulomonas composti]GEL95125.1 pilus biosynthesis protein CpaE [Cellulomonas composti]
MTIPVLCGVRGAGETAVVRALDDAPGLRVTRRCADLTELLAAAEAGLGRVAVVSAALDGLDVAAVAAVRASGVVVVALVEPERTTPAERARVAGADLVLDVPAGQAAAAVLARRVLALCESSTSEGDPWDETPAPTARAERGGIVAVWGPTGAPGRSTVAVNLAAEIAALGTPTLLADADTYGGCVAQLLGVLDDAPGLAAACRAAAAGTLDLVTLARLAGYVAPDLRLLSGISRADRWTELGSAALDAVWVVARSLAAVTVVDCGFSVEQDEALSYDTRAPRRNAATLGALAAADVVVVVGSADPVGVQRLVRALADLSDLGLTSPRHVVVNRVRASVAGPRPAQAVAQALARYAAVVDPVLVPEDRDALDAAVLEARTLREIAPGSPARRALQQLVGLVASGGPVGAAARSGADVAAYA